MDRVRKFGSRKSTKPLFFAVAVLLFILQPATANATVGYATAASLKLDDSRPAVTTRYTFTSTVSSTNAAQAIGCIEVRFSKTPTNTTIPDNMDVSGATFDSGNSSYQASWSGWAIAADGGGAAQSDFANGLITLVDGNGGLTDPIDTAGDIEFTGILNGNTPEVAYYTQFNTFADAGCTTPADTATVAFIYENGQLVSVTVDPSLSFTLIGTTAGNYNDASHCQNITNGITPNITTTNGTVPFGHPTVGANSIGMQRLTVGTNAAGGMYVYTWADQQLTNTQDNTKTIPAITASNAVPVASGTSFASGTAGWGYSTSSNNTTGVNLSNNRFATDKWAPYITAGNTDNVFYANGIPVDSSTSTGSAGNYAGGKFCMGYQVGLSSITAAGYYTATVIYNAVPTY